MSEAALSIPARIAPRPLTWPHRQRLPAGDGANTLPGLRGVGDARKQSAQLDGSRLTTRSNAVRIAAASASVTTNIQGAWGLGS
jgi:hypothetical protein